MSSGWGCPHEVDGLCRKLNQIKCDPGMKGCVLFGRFTFSEADKNMSEQSRKRRNRHIRQRTRSDYSE
ncbi:MAG: hypothetical protein HQL54_10260 [Magnetococcales bacterium]|nr:hypothetical protein [Magnetococcales bacterium]